MVAAAGIFSHHVTVVIIDVIRVVLGALWVVAALSKLRAPAATQAAFGRLLGTRFESFPVWPLAAGELLLGGMLLVGWEARTAAIVSAALFICFAFLLGRAAVRGALADTGCGCFGTPSRGSAADPSSESLAIARNLVLATLAFAVIHGV